MRHPNIELAERAWEAVATSDVEALDALWAPDIVWHVTTDNPWYGDHVGRAAVLDYLADVGEAGEAYDARLDDVLVSDHRILLVTSVTARRGARSVETKQCMLVRVERGRMAEVWTLALDPTAMADFWKPTSKKTGKGTGKSAGHLTAV